MALIMLVIIGLMPCVLLFFHLVFIKVAMIIRKNCLLLFLMNLLLLLKTNLFSPRAPLVPTLG
jgi:hypothetical protein